jgi:hypothetical protein
MLLSVSGVDRNVTASRNYGAVLFPLHLKPFICRVFISYILLPATSDVIQNIIISFTKKIILVVSSFHDLEISIPKQLPFS